MDQHVALGKGTSQKAFLEAVVAPSPALISTLPSKWPGAPGPQPPSPRNLWALMHLWALMQEPSPEVHGLAVIIGLLEVASELSKVPVSMRIDWNRQCSDKIPIAFWIHHRLDQSWSMLLVWPGSGWGAWGVCHVINMHQNPPELHNTTPPELHNANTELSLRCAPPEFEALPADPHPMLASAPTLRPASNSLSAGVTLVVIVLR